jgi:hypothetical protein
MQFLAAGAPSSRGDSFSGRRIFYPGLASYRIPGGSDVAGVAPLAWSPRGEDRNATDLVEHHPAEVQGD